MNMEKLRKSQLYNPRWWLLLPINLAMLLTAGIVSLMLCSLNIVFKIISDYAESSDDWFNNQFDWYDRLNEWMRKGHKNLCQNKEQ